MERESSLPHSQLPATCPYPEPARSSPYHFLWDPSQFPACCANWSCPTQTPTIPRTKPHVSFRCSGRTKLSVQVRGTCSCFVTNPVFTVRICQHLGQPPSWRTTPCRLFSTVFQYICNYPPYCRPLLHPQPEDAPCRGDRDQLINQQKHIHI